MTFVQSGKHSTVRQSADRLYADQGSGDDLEDGEDDNEDDVDGSGGLLLFLSVFWHWDIFVNRSVYDLVGLAVFTGFSSEIDRIFCSMNLDY